MGVTPALFASAGRRTDHLIPGVYSRSMAIPNISGGVSAGNLCIMGKSNAGKPQTLLAFSSLGEAQEVIDGFLLKAVGYAFSPAPGYTPQRVFAMRVNPGTQSKVILEKSNEPYIGAKPLLWGLVANNAAIKVSDGTETGTKKVQVRYKGGIDEVDNIAHAPLRIKYEGEIENLIAAIQNNKFTVSGTKVDYQRQTSANIVYANDGVSTVEDLVAALTREGQTASIGATAGVSVALLDPQDAVPIALQHDCRFTSGISVRYTGNVGPASLNVTDTGLALVLGGITQEVIDWTDAPTVEDLVAEINAVTDFEATSIVGTMPTYLIDNGIDIMLSDTDTPLVSRVAFSITGGGNSPQLTIGNTAATVTALLSHSTPVTLIDADFADYPLVGDLYEVIQAQSGFEVEITDETLDADDSCRLLDWFPETPIGDDWFDIRGDGFAFIEALKNMQLIDPDSPELEAEYMSGFPDNTSDFVPFEGGTNGAYDSEAWQSALAKIALEDIQIIATANTDSAVHTLIKNHCEICGSVQNRRERKCWLGGAIGETPEQAAAKAKALNSSVTTYCYPWIRAGNPLTGVAETIDAGYYACMCAGLESALDVHIPLTNKMMNVLSWGVKLTNTQLEMLIKSGVSAGGMDEDENLVNIRAMTTWQGKELQLCENSMVREDMYMNRDLRSAFKPVIGTPVTNGDIAIARGTLLAKARSWAGYGYITPNDEGHNVWGISIKVNGDVTEITFNRNLTSPRNFVFITARNYVYTSETNVGV